MDVSDRKARINKALERDNAFFVSISDTFNLKKTTVTFKCHCGTEHTKGFFTLEKYDNSAKCKECTNTQMKNKLIKTNNEKHGYDFAIQTKENFAKEFRKNDK
jgi:hypothetical protein